MTNAQAALMAAAGQIDPTKGPYTLPAPDGSGLISVNFDVATRTVAAGYLNWLDQQDTLAARLPNPERIPS